MADRNPRPRRNLSVDPAKVRALIDRQVGYYEDTAEPAPETHDVNGESRDTEEQGGERPSTRHLRRRAAGLDPLRAEALSMFQPKIPVATAHDVREAVVGQILLVPFTSDKSDRSMCSILYRFADYVYEQKGTFCPDEHLTDRLIQHYIKDREGELKRSSQRTHRSTLLRIREGHPEKPRRPRIERGRPAPPYTKEEWRLLRSRTQTLLDQSAKAQITMVLDLTGEAGLRTQEAIRATGEWIHLIDGATFVRIPDGKGEWRDVPVFGAVAERLGRHRDSKDWLIAPWINSRQNVMTKMRALADGHPGLAGLDPIRARNTWIVNLLTQRIPSNVVWSVAGVKPGAGGHTISDLLTYTPTPEARTILRDLNHARIH